MEGYVKLYRQTIRSPVFADAEMWKLATWCLCKASRLTRAQPIDCGPIKKTVQLYPGDFVTGRHRGAEELGWHPSTFRNRLARLENEFGFIATRQDKHFTVVSVCKWGNYQGDEPEGRTDEGQAKDKRRTAGGQPEDTNKKEENVENVDNADNEKKTPQNPPEGNDKKLTKAKKHDEAVKNVEIPTELNTDAFREVFFEFCDERREKRSYVTGRALSKLLKKLKPYGPEVAVTAIEDSIANGWQGVFPDKNKHAPSPDSGLTREQEKEFEKL